jgi:PAS domain S-box-containing protein
MEAALDAVILMDHEGTITEYNAAAERTFGYSREEVLGKPLGDVLVPPALRDRHRAGLRRHLETGERTILGRRIEVPAMRKDGTEFPAEVAVVRIDVESKPLFTGYVRDITERRQAAEAELLRRQKEAADTANRELEAFSYSVAHDLRAPLRGISGFSGALLEAYGDKLDEDGRALLARVMASTKRMGLLIDALLALARLSRREVRLEVVNFTEAARSIIEHLRASEPTRSVAFIATDGITAIGDPQLLRAVLENLLGNAWKFTRNRTHARIELGCAMLPDAIHYYVRDNGAGFDMQFAHRLFTPFQRLHSTAEFEGTGVGLATVQRIIHRHGGRVWADSKESEGATFQFTLPRASLTKGIS